jgi:glyoxylase-like metal-dependent hydrolase (beta-lactamase superfamily II)
MLREPKEELTMKRTVSIALFALTLSACASAEKRTIDAAAAALGGSDRIQAVKTLTIEGEGTNGNLGQDLRPEATSQMFKVTAYKRTIDVAGNRARVEQTREPNFTYFQGQAPIRQVLGIDGDVAYNVAPTGVATRAPNPVATDRRIEIYHHPVTIVRAALDPAAKLSNPRTEGNENLVDVTTAGGLNFTLAVDSSTGRPARVTSKVNNTNLGDVMVETSFADYQEANGLQLPTRLLTKTDNITTSDIHVTRQVVDAEAGDLTAPAAAASAAPITGTEPATVTAEQIGKGIWYLAGQSHHSVLVEFKDHLALIESPQNEIRTLAVIAKARELRPDKPLTQLISTHHHFDHSGGIRAAVSEGLTIIAHAGSADHYRDAVAKPHTVMPDALTRNPKPLKIEVVQDQMVLDDGTMTVNLYRMDGSPHADTLLMAYFPKERVLVEADVFSPGAAVDPFAANLMDNIRKRNLRVDRIAPLHGKVVPYSELVKAVQKGAANRANS